MIIYYLPNIEYAHMLPHKLNLTFSKTKPTIFLSESMANYLQDSKKKIHNNDLEWNKYKKYLNPYEYIHTIAPKYNKSVSKLSPVSRSFYKLIEILQHFNILSKFQNNNMSSFHLAEGPGGFIEAMVNLRKHPLDKHYSMTLLDNTNNYIPNWNKLKKNYAHCINKNIVLYEGHNRSGNLFDKENLLFCYKNHLNSMDLITGDGGIDFSANFDDQEILATRLLLAQILYAIIMQKHEGTFIIKFFDTFTYPTVQLIYLLKKFYQEVCVCKPNTSRFANSEKYIICNKFKYADTHCFIEKFCTILDEIKNNEDYITSIININIPLQFLSYIEDCNILLGKQEITTINQTLQLMEIPKTNKINKFVKQNLQKCVQWCSTHHIPIHDDFVSSNIFLTCE
jgi:23S rRNA U2552 (ribose-2'-O)-methylase RlmE/FtsJ